MSENFFDQSIEILRSTHDGDVLAPQDLKLVEIAVNGWLNEAGEVAFAELLPNVRRGYKPPWFMGIEHLTRDHQRYVYGKGKLVEHYDHDFWQEERWRERMNADAEELARRCRWLEEQGKEVNSTTVVSQWRNPPEWTVTK